MKVLAGQIADRLGHARQEQLSFDGQVASHYEQFLALPSTSYRDRQQRVPVTIEHRTRIGRLEHLELNEDDKLTAVCSVDARIVDFSEWWFSPTVRHGPGGTDIELLELAATRHPASICLTPIRVIDGDFRHRHVQQRLRDPRDRELLERAVQSSHIDGDITIRRPHIEARNARLTDPVAIRQAVEEDFWRRKEQHPPPRRKLEYSAPYHGILRVS